MYQPTSRSRDGYNRRPNALNLYSTEQRPRQRGHSVLTPLKVEVGRDSSIVDTEAVVAVRRCAAIGTGVEVDACAGVSRKTEWGQRKLKGAQLLHVQQSPTYSHNRP